ncbi:MAG: MOSC domain-containing protein [Campylobacterota bacterium]|nr:MOSC domain-containing protein [Campylobacterota bacterium]
MKKVGKVLSLFSSLSEGQINVTSLSLDIKGIIDDKHYDRNPDRAVLISSLYSYELMKEQSIISDYGTLGENILMDYNIYHLKSGVRLKIGANVVVELGQSCTLCKGLSAINSKLPKLLKDDRGIFVKVIESGVIYTDDAIYLLD